jgi:hypothetical protein
MRTLATLRRHSVRHLITISRIITYDTRTKRQIHETTVFYLHIHGSLESTIAIEEGSGMAYSMVI